MQGERKKRIADSGDQISGGEEGERLLVPAICGGVAILPWSLHCEPADCAGASVEMTVGDVRDVEQFVKGKKRFNTEDAEARAQSSQRRETQKGWLKRPALH
jgi:hypothetical protein